MKTFNLRSLLPHKDFSDVDDISIEQTSSGIHVTFKNKLGFEIKELPAAKKLRCTKNLVKATRTATSRCYDNAIKAVAKANSVQETDVFAKSKTLYKNEVDETYRNLICKLETEILESILICHNKGKLRRAEITLRTINDELARRTILDDSSRSR